VGKTGPTKAKRNHSNWVKFT